MKPTCIICGEPRSGFHGFAPCKNGHTMDEEIAFADEHRWDSAHPAMVENLKQRVLKRTHLNEMTLRDQQDDQGAPE